MLGCIRSHPGLCVACGLQVGHPCWRVTAELVHHSEQAGGGGLPSTSLWRQPRRVQSGDMLSRGAGAASGPFGSAAAGATARHRHWHRAFPPDFRSHGCSKLSSGGRDLSDSGCLFLPGGEAPTKNSHGSAPGTHSCCVVSGRYFHTPSYVSISSDRRQRGHLSFYLRKLIQP